MVSLQNVLVGPHTSRRELVSVIIPVHNGEAFLAAAVASIRSQSFPAIEIIIIDDGSTDGTPGLIGHLGSDIVTAHQPQRGPAAARNHGLTLAHGEFIAFLDADDLWPTDKLHSQINRLREDPSLDVVLGRVQPIQSDDMIVPEDQDMVSPVVTVQVGSAVFRRAIFQRVGIFDETLYFSEDHDWFLRAREQHVRLAVMAQVTLLYRRHPGNMTRGRNHQGYQLVKVLKASLDRRRVQAGGHVQSLAMLADFDDARPGQVTDHHEGV